MALLISAAVMVSDMTARQQDETDAADEEQQQCKSYVFVTDGSLLYFIFKLQKNPMYDDVTCPPTTGV